MRHLPLSWREALRRLGTVEDNFKPLVGDFCMDHSRDGKTGDCTRLPNITRRHRCISILVHTENFATGPDSDRIAAGRSMQILSRDKSTVENEVSFEEIENRTIAGFIVLSEAVYS